MQPILNLFKMAALPIAIIAIAAHPLSAQTRASSGSIVVTGDNNIVTKGWTEKEYQASLRAALKPLEARSVEDRKNIATLQRKAGATDAQLVLILQLAGQENVAEDERWKILGQIVGEYSQLKAAVGKLPSSEVKADAVKAIVEVRLDVAQRIVAAEGFRRQLLQEVQYKVDGQGAVTFLDKWDERNIASIHIRQLEGVDVFGESKFGGTFKFYKAAHPALLAVFDELEKEGLIPKITQWCGAYWPRTVRGSLQLSAHAFGLAIDLNCRQLVRGRPSPSDFVAVADVFERHGFIWGGRYSGVVDPMHFQFAGPETGNQAPGD